MREFGRPKIKVLPLCGWMTQDGLKGMCQKLFNDCVERIEHYVKVKPRFNRPGWYFEGGIAWFETKAGNAYREVSNANFIYELTMQNLSELRKEDIAGIKAIAKSSFATKKQKKLAKDLADFEYIEKHKRRSKICLMASTKRVKLAWDKLKAKNTATD